MANHALQKPTWAGEDTRAKFVNWLIGIKPLYALMKWQARRLMIRTAESNGIPWRQSVTQLQRADVQAYRLDIEDETLNYPIYYQVPFHGYAAGNLCWQAAFEAESATYAIAMRVWPQENLTWQAAQARLRGNFYKVLDRYLAGPLETILDLGCSVGVSTLALHRHYGQAYPGAVRTVGLDLSAYMLAVAQTRDIHQEIAQWRHASAEQTGLLTASFDLVTLQFVTHELPRTAARAIFEEALRLLRPGGTLAIADNDPQSPVIQALPPVLFTLMKSTEPWSDDYYTFDIEAALIEIGYEDVQATATDPRHRAILGRKPKHKFSSSLA